MSEREASYTAGQKEHSRREAFIQRVESDFIYKPGTPEQHEVYQWIDNMFYGLRSLIAQKFDYSPVDVRLIHTPEYQKSLDSLRVAERRCNAAVANEWKKDSAFDIEEAKPTLYPAESENDAPEFQKLCHTVTKAYFEIVSLMVKHLPHGDYIEKFVDEMEVARGWALDAINNHVPKQ